MSSPQEPAASGSLAYELATPNAYTWTEGAYDLLEEGLLHASITSKNKIQTATASGQCPRCKHDVRFEQVLDVVTGEDFGTLGTAVAPNADPYVAVIVSCRCTEAHAARPDGIQHGCGINFRVELIPGIE